MSGPYIVNFRGWPDDDEWRPRKPPTGYSDRLLQRNALVAHAASDKGAEGDVFGLGAVWFVAGPSVVAGTFLVADDLGDRDPEALAGIEEFAADHPVCSRPGAPAFEVLTLGRFFDPKATVGCGHLAFAPNAYTGRTFTIGADLGRFFGLVAEHLAPRNHPYSDSWDLWLPGWGVAGPEGNWHRATPHRPCLRLTARRAGWQVTWGPCLKFHGQQHPGEFVDLASLAYALDGDRGASYGEHREDAGLSPADLPYAVSVNAAGASQLVEAVGHLHEFALVLDEKAAQWFTTPRERSEGSGRLSLSRTVSPGAIAAEISPRFRVEAPLAKFDLSPAEHTAWAESFHGGVCDAHPGAIGLVLPAASLDLTSAFPLAANLVDWWDVRTVERLGREDVTSDLRELCRLAIDDPTVVLDPAAWHRFGLTLAKTIPAGEPWPIEVEDERRPDGRFEVVPVYSPERPMFLAWPAVVAAAVLSGRVPTICRATRLVPEGRQPGLRRRIPVLPGLVLDVNEDPGVALVLHRQAAKAAGNLDLAAELRVIVNSLTFGNMARFDEQRRMVGREWVIGERPGPENFLPIASTVTAGAYLLLAVLERCPLDLGSAVLYRDTDSSVIPCLPDGGIVTLRDGSRVNALSWQQLDSIVAKFDGLRVFGPEVPVWKVARGTAEHPAQTLIAGPKRHVEFVDGDAGAIEILHRTDTRLGGTYADPPAIPGRARDGHRFFSLAALKDEIAFVRTRKRDPENALRPVAAWDAGQPLPFPAVRRLRVGSPAMLASLPKALGARAGTGYLEFTVDTMFARQVPGYSGGGVIALDPGDDLSGWHDLVSFDRRTGVRVRVTTDRLDSGAVLLVSLAEKAVDWGRPSRVEPIAEVHVDPLLVRHVGRVSGVLDAADEGAPKALRPVYSAADLTGALRKYLDAWGAPRFAARTGLAPRTVRAFASGRRLSKANAHRALRALRIDDGACRTCALDGCDHPVLRARAKYCSERCRATARKRRQRAKAEGSDGEAT